MPKKMEEIQIELNRLCYKNAIRIEWVDNDAGMRAQAKAAVAKVVRGDLAV